MAAAIRQLPCSPIHGQLTGSADISSPYYLEVFIRGERSATLELHPVHAKN
jgi:hypothetical protein